MTFLTPLKFRHWNLFDCSVNIDKNSSETAQVCFYRLMWILNVARFGKKSTSFSTVFVKVENSPKWFWILPIVDQFDSQVHAFFLWLFIWSGNYQAHDLITSRFFSTIKKNSKERIPANRLEHWTRKIKIQFVSWHNQQRSSCNRIAWKWRFISFCKLCNFSLFEECLECLWTILKLFSLSFSSRNKKRK